MALLLRTLLSCVHLVSFLVHFSPGTSAAIPLPNGTYGVSLSTIKLTDTSRLDPFAPKPKNRSVMISAFFPSAHAKKCQKSLVRYMPPATAAIQDQTYFQYGVPNGTFDSIELSLCKQTLQVANIAQDFPLVLFSPGLGNSRLLYNAMAQSVACYGFIVVTIDHPYDANVVEYPNGEVVLAANISSPAQIELDLQTRSLDVSFVLDQLSHVHIVQRLLPSIKTGLRTNSVAMFGHSLGGATAAAAMVNDSRIIGGVNLDGTFFGPAVQQGLDNPFLLFGHEGKNQSSDATWADIWPHLNSWKIELMLDGAQHATFSDLPLLVDVLGFRNKLPGAAELLGNLAGTRALQVITDYLVAFFGSGLKCKPAALLQGPSRAYEEVVFVAAG